MDEATRVLGLVVMSIIVVDAVMVMMVMAMVVVVVVVDRVTLMSARAWLASHCGRNVQFTYISAIHRIQPTPLRNLHLH